MPGVGEATNAEGGRLIPDEDMWAIVHYVKSLSDGADMRIHPEGHEVVADAGGHGGDGHDDHDAAADHEEGQ